MSDSITSDHVAVLQLWDNVAYHAVSCEDTIIPCRKEIETGKYHVDGDLMLAPPELLAPFIKNCLPIFNMLQDRPKLVTVPLPRYLTLPCCEDAEHIPNQHEDGFQRAILSGLEKLKKGIRDTLFSNGVRNLKVVSPLWLMVGPKTNDEDLQAKLADLWKEDPVHPSPSGYLSLLNGLRREASALQQAGGKKRKVAPPIKIPQPEWRAGPTARQDHWPRGSGQRPNRGHWPRYQAPVGPRYRGRGFYAAGRGYLHNKKPY
jgi:hypothetical protein